MDPTHGAITYFSMEIDLEAGMPTYSGGLGVLAGDTIRAAADLKVSSAVPTFLCLAPEKTVQLLDRIRFWHLPCF